MVLDFPAIFCSFKTPQFPHRFLLFWWGVSGSATSFLLIFKKSYQGRLGPMLVICCIKRLPPAFDFVGNALVENRSRQDKASSNGQP